MHKVKTARPVAAAFGVFWNYRGRAVPCEAYTMGADGCPTSGDDASSQELADAFERGATFLTYEGYLTEADAKARPPLGPNYSVRPLPAGWYFYDGEQLCVVAPAEPAGIEPRARTVVDLLRNVAGLDDRNLFPSSHAVLVQAVKEWREEARKLIETGR